MQKSNQPFSLNPQPHGALKATNPLATASEAEKKLLKIAIDGLKGNITKGVEFVTTSSKL